MRMIRLAPATMLGMILAMQNQAQSTFPFLKAGFPVPEELVTDDYRLRMLSIHDVVKDYDAVISSTPHLRTMLPASDGWPEGLTLEQNLIDLAWHQKEFERRTSFTYTVISLDGETVLGCVYIFPTRKAGFDAEITLWARESAQGSPSDIALEKTVRAWVAKEWSFANPAFPGRDLTWEEWDATPDEKR